MWLGAKNRGHRASSSGPVSASLSGSLVSVYSGTVTPVGGNTGIRTLQSMTLTTSGADGEKPFTIGFGFKKGDAATIATSLSHCQVDVKRRWNDGTIKHAIVSGRANFVAGSASFSITNGSYSPGTSLTVAALESALNTANLNKVQCGSFGTVDLSGLIGTVASSSNGYVGRVRTWIQGSEAVECHYRGDVGGGTDLVVWFHARLHANGQVWVRAVMENGYLDDGSGNKATLTARSYVPTVTLNGSVVYNNGGATLAHYAGSRWKAEKWSGVDPAITPRHDLAYLVSSKLVPNYGFGSGAVSAATLAGTPYLVTGGNTIPTLAPGGWTQTYTPMTADWVPANMADAGYAPHIGVLPTWDALYVKTGDSRAWNTMVVGESNINTYNIAFRNRSNKTVPRPSDFALWSIDGPNQGGNDGTVTSGSPWNWEVNHHPAAGYLGYLLTGEYWHYETLAFSASLCYLCPTRGIPGGTQKILLVRAPRGIGWMLRTVSLYCGVAPDSELVNGGVAGALEVGGDYQQLLANNMTYWKDLKNQSGFTPIGYLREGGISANGTGTTAPWQHHFWIAGLGLGSDTEPLSSMSDYTNVRDHMYRAVVGILGGASGSDYCYTRATASNAIVVSSVNDTDPRTWYQDWATIYAATQVYASNFVPPQDWSTCPASLQGSSAASPTAASFGNWGHLLAAISYAVDHGATNAQAAFNRLSSDSTTNWKTELRDGQTIPWEDSPHLGMTPRNYNPYISVPYTLPSSGELKSIHQNALSSVYPGTGQWWDTGARINSPWANWNAGCYADQYSQYGAMVFWGGGHANYDGTTHAIFDLTTGRWSYIGSDPPFDPWGTSGNPTSGLTDPTWCDYNWNGSYIMPCHHTYGHPVYIPPDVAGNEKGSWYIGFAVVGAYSSTGAIINGSMKPHSVDLATGIWSRALPAPGNSNDGQGTGCVSIYDPSRNIIYLMEYYQQAPVYRINLNTSFGSRTIERLDTMGGAPYYGDIVYVPEFDVFVSVGDLISGPAKLYVWDCQDAGGVPRSYAPPQSQSRLPFNTTGNIWGIDYCPETGKFYCHETVETAQKPTGENRLHVLTPPSGARSNWFTGTWTWSTETMSGENPACVSETAASGQAAGRYAAGVWRYNRTLKCFMWSAGAVVRNGRDGAFQLYKPIGVS